MEQITRDGGRGSLAGTGRPKHCDGRRTHTGKLLVPRGVHYELDSADHPSRWPWVFGGLLLMAGLTGLWFTFHSSTGKTPSSRRSMSDASSVSVEPGGPQIQTSPGGATNSALHWPTSVSAEVRRLMEGAEAAVRAGDFPSARRRYLEILNRGSLGVATAFVEQRLGEIGMFLVLSSHSMPEKTEHIVKSGESADQIARQFNVTRELLMKSNDLQPSDKLQPEQHLLVLDNPVFAIVINRGANELRLFLNGKLLKSYRIGTGRREDTPAGTFVIRNRQEHPVWVRPDGRKIPYGRQDNILGTRWMSLQATGTTAVAKGCGIHGTWNESDLGHASLSGCVHMRNADVEELCLVVPDGAPVRILE